MSVWASDDLKDELPARPTYEAATETNFIIAPITGWYGSVQPSTLHLTPAQAEKIANGQGRLIVYGFIEYADVGEKLFKIHFAFGFDFNADGASARYFPTGHKRYWQYT
jgi:hypothetical protein